MAITNYNKEKLNDREEPTGVLCTYHRVVNITDMDEGVSFTVKSYLSALEYNQGKGALIDTSFFCPATAENFPFSEVAQLQTSTSLRSLIEQELVGGVDTSPNYKFRGYLGTGTIV